MRMKKLVSRAKKFARAKHTRRTRMAIAAFGVVVAVTGAVAASSMFATAARPSDDHLAATRAVENKQARAELAAPAADYAAASSTSTAARAKAPAITLTGCLERHGDDYRLKDAAGADAPRARSWKSGFLKKSTPAIDVVDAGNRLKLNDHVGERVSVSGVLSDREMQASKLKNVSSSCTD